jgi:hypothetical protein
MLLGTTNALSFQPHANPGTSELRLLADTIVYKTVEKMAKPKWFRHAQNVRHIKFR